MSYYVEVSRKLLKGKLEPLLAQILYQGIKKKKKHQFSSHNFILNPEGDKKESILDQSLQKSSATHSF